MFVQLEKFFSFNLVGFCARHSYYIFPNLYFITTSAILQILKDYKLNTEKDLYNYIKYDDTTGYSDRMAMHSQ